MNKILKIGQVVIINNISYTVVGMIEFQEDTWVWQEYKLKGSNLDINWLSVEEDDGKTQYSLYKEYYGIPNCNSVNLKYDNENYTLLEKGTARVKRFYGSVDVDKNEKVEFKEYINEKKDKLLSYEDWSGELEKSKGSYIPEGNIQITDEIKNTQQLMNAKPAAKFFIVFYSILIILGIMIGVFTPDKSISKVLKNSSDFTYVTSITNNENNKKAKVYKTDLTVEEAVKKIIDGAPESIKKVSDANDEDGGIGLFTNSEYAYVYKSEDDVTYVQVSKKKFVSSNSRAYHSRYHSTGYYRTYTTNSTNKTYTDYLGSARQQSINSRKSSGGGTSSGK